MISTKEIMEIINRNYSKTLSLFAMHNTKIKNHILRVSLKMKDRTSCKAFVDYYCKIQKNDNGWGLSDNSVSIPGVSATVLQLLMWYYYEIDVDTNVYDRIKSGIEYLINNSNYSLLETSPRLKTIGHGIIDVNHYITQDLYYYVYCFSNSEPYYSIRTKMVEDICKIQSDDGGWHEIDKIRMRCGVTSDAIRALLPDKKNYYYINKGIIFLLNNQNPYHGYWECGNLDKIFDVLKTLINSHWLLEKDIQIKNEGSIEKGLKYLLQNIEDSKLNEEEICDYLAVLLDYLDFRTQQETVKLFF